MIDSVRTQKLMNTYARIGQAVRMKLLDRYPAKLIWGVFEDTRKELAFLAPKIPYIGEKNIWQINLDTCVLNMALYRTLMKPLKFSATFSMHICRVFQNHFSGLTTGITSADFIKNV
jgi:hypothetical protein